LLHWIEVMSLLADINSVFTALRDVKPWFQVCPACLYILMRKHVY
jgi:hypothetical protein